MNVENFKDPLFDNSYVWYSIVRKLWYGLKVKLEDNLFYSIMTEDDLRNNLIFDLWGNIDRKLWNEHRKF